MSTDVKIHYCLMSYFDCFDFCIYCIIFILCEIGMWSYVDIEVNVKLEEL